MKNVIEKTKVMGWQTRESFRGLQAIVKKQQAAWKAAMTCSEKLAAGCIIKKGVEEIARRTGAQDVVKKCGIMWDGWWELPKAEIEIEGMVGYLEAGELFF